MIQLIKFHFIRNIPFSHPEIESNDIKRSKWWWVDRDRTVGLHFCVCVCVMLKGILKKTSRKFFNKSLLHLSRRIYLFASSVSLAGFHSLTPHCPLHSQQPPTKSIFSPIFIFHFLFRNTIYLFVCSKIIIIIKKWCKGWKKMERNWNKNCFSQTLDVVLCLLVVLPSILIDNMNCMYNERRLSVSRLYADAHT